MKKIFTTLAIFAALALTACSGTPAQSGNQKSGSQNTQTTSKHTHKYGDWTQVTAPTCEGKGKEERVCECGEKQTRDVDALGHKWDNGVVTKEATCSVPGEKKFTCSVCNATKTEEIKADHVWGEAVAITGAEDEVAANEFTCTLCSAKKIEFAAKQASGKSTIDGSLKSDSQFPDYLKLNSNGNSVTYKFTYNKAGSAKIYMRGVMDYWHDGNNENQTRNFFSGKNSQDGNFELKVNDVAVDYSATKDLTYEDMLPGEAQGTYSPLGDALVGACNLVDGPNTVVFKRTESYNMLIKDFVIIFD